MCIGQFCLGVELGLPRGLIMISRTERANHAAVFGIDFSFKQVSMATIETREVEFIGLHGSFQITIITGFSQKCPGQIVALLFEFTNAFVFVWGSNFKSGFPTPAHVHHGVFAQIGKTVIAAVAGQERDAVVLPIAYHPFTVDGVFQKITLDVGVKYGEIYHNGILGLAFVTPNFNVIHHNTFIPIDDLDVKTVGCDVDDLKSERKFALAHLFKLEVDFIGQRLSTWVGVDRVVVEFEDRPPFARGQTRVGVFCGKKTRI